MITLFESYAKYGDGVAAGCEWFLIQLAMFAGGFPRNTSTAIFFSLFLSFERFEIIYFVYKCLEK